MSLHTWVVPDCLRTWA